MSDLQDFQAEPLGPGSEGFLIRVGVITTLIRKSDRRIVAATRFTATETAGADDTLTLVGGFDRALQTVLRQVVVWTGQQVR